MEFRILGPVELWSAGRQRDVGSGKSRQVLAVLLLTPATVVPADVLIDRLWDTRPPAKARETLSAYVTRLRRSLERAAGDAAPLTGRAGGYALDIDPETVDLHQFRRLCEQARNQAADRREMAVVLREADRLWRGPALAGIRGDWIARMRHSLEEERRGAIAERVRCELELGRHTELVGELGGLLAQYPLDETLIACQMTALYRAGRTSDALRTYLDARSRLVDEQGTEPGPALAELHQRILRHDPDLAARPLSAQASEPESDLPPETEDFTGRDEEIAVLTAKDSDGPRIVVIQGAAGAGKTQFAIRAARMLAGHYPDGTLYLDFGAQDLAGPPIGPGEALSRLLRMLGIPAAQIPHTLAELTASWRAHLVRRAVVVILDDATEYDQISPLLPVAGRCLFLITARRELDGLRNAQVLTLGLLPDQDAVSLFTRITGTASERGRPERDEAAAVLQLCGRLPLAIQLTAARLAHRDSACAADPPGAFQPAVRRDSADLASGEVAAAFDLSYKALKPSEQRFLRLLGLNPSPQVSQEAAAALTGTTPARAQEGLAALLDRRLLAPVPPGQYRFHDLIRGYAAVRCAEDEPAPERRQAIGRLLDYYLAGADQADRVLYPFRRRVAATISLPAAPMPALATQVDAAAWLESEWRNILHAARYAGSHQWEQHCADLTHRLAGFMDTRGFWGDALAAGAVALQACRSLDDPSRVAQASLALCAIMLQVGTHDGTAGLAEDAAAIYRSQADRRGLAEALDQIGLIRQRAGLSQEARAYFQEARALYDEVTDTHGVATALSHSGIASWHLGRYPDAMSQLRAALALYREAGDQRGVAKTLNNLGKMQLHDGQHQDALASFEASLEIFTTIDGAQSQAILHHNIGAVHYRTGNHADALAAYGLALATYRTLGDLPDEADVLNDIAAVYDSAGRHAAALLHYEQARLIAAEIGNQAVEITALRGIADLRSRAGQRSEALQDYRTALHHARQIGDPYEEAKILAGIAETRLAAHDRREARIAFRQALDIFEILGAPEAESVRTRLESTSRTAKRSASLGAWRRERHGPPLCRVVPGCHSFKILVTWSASGHAQDACNLAVRVNGPSSHSARPETAGGVMTKPPTISAARQGKESALVESIQAHRRSSVSAARRPQGTGRGPSSHLCPVTGCRRPVDRLMCSRHWYQVPKPLRDAVWATWRSGAGKGTPEHIDAIIAAIAAAFGHGMVDGS